MISLTWMICERVPVTVYSCSVCCYLFQFRLLSVSGYTFPSFMALIYPVRGTFFLNRISLSELQRSAAITRWSLSSLSRDLSSFLSSRAFAGWNCPSLPLEIVSLFIEGYLDVPRKLPFFSDQTLSAGIATQRPSYPRTRALRSP